MSKDTYNPSQITDDGLLAKELQQHSAEVVAHTKRKLAEFEDPVETPNSKRSKKSNRFQSKAGISDENSQRHASSNANASSGVEKEMPVLRTPRSRTRSSKSSKTFDSSQNGDDDDNSKLQMTATEDANSRPTKDFSKRKSAAISSSGEVITPGHSMPIIHIDHDPSLTNLVSTKRHYSANAFPSAIGTSNKNVDSSMILRDKIVDYGRSGLDSKAKPSSSPASFPLYHQGIGKIVAVILFIAVIVLLIQLYNRIRTHMPLEFSNTNRGHLILPPSLSFSENYDFRPFEEHILLKMKSYVDSAVTDRFSDIEAFNNKPSSSPCNINPLMEEMRLVSLKIKELGDLHIALDESKTITETQVQSLSSKVDQLKTELSTNLQSMMSAAALKDKEEFDTKVQSLLSIRNSYATKFEDEAVILEKLASIEMQLQQKLDENFEIYSNDKINKTDFALQSMGAFIIDSSPTYRPSLSFYLLPNMMTPPAVILSPSVVPGNCWAFASGQVGFVTIHLAEPIDIETVSIDNPIFAMDSDASGVKDFSVIAILDDPQGEVVLGNFTRVYPGGKFTQTFPINVHTTAQRVVSLVRFEFLSNYGNRDYTCVYRVRVHGTPSRMILQE